MAVSGRTRAVLILTLFLLPSLFFAAPLKVVSVLYFDNTTANREYSWLTKGLPDMLTTGLSQSDNIRVVDRNDLKKVLDEQKLALTGLADEKSAIRVGKLLNANFLVRGSFIIQGDTLRIDARIIDTETGRLKSAELTGKTADVFRIVNDLAGKLLLQVLLTPAGTQQQIQIGTSSLDAAKLYYQGLELLDTTNVGLAIEKFNQSRAADPFYSRPQMGLEEAYKFLKDFKKLRQQRELRELFEQLSAYRARSHEKPFRTYADILRESNWTNMTQDERDKFNQKYQVVIMTQTPGHAAWMSMIKLLEIASKQQSLFNEQWDETEEIFNRKEREIKDRQNKETWEVHNRSIALVTNKTLTADEKDKLRKELDIYSDGIDKKHDAEDKTLDAEEKKLDNDRKDGEAELARRNQPFLTEMVAIAEAARTDYRDDSFLPEILYMELMAFREMKDYTRLKDYSEKFLLEQPKFRMIESVEDFYKTALDQLKEKNGK